MILWVHYRNGEGGKGPGFCLNPDSMAYTTKFGTARNTCIHRMDGGAMVIWESESQLFHMIETRRLQEQNSLTEANPA